MNLHSTASIVHAVVAAAAISAAAAAAADQGHAHEHAAGGAVASAPVVGPADAATLYHEYCSVCHGDRGDGESRAKGSMVPPPRDFTAPQARELTRAAMVAAVTKGKDGTAMPPWETQLSEAQIAALVDYIRNTFVAPLDSETADEGARLYARTCSVCHGDAGSGALWAASNLNPPPRDFTSTQSAAELGRERMIHSVTFGRPDTAMPGFGTQLGEHQIESVVDFVRRAFMRTAAMPARDSNVPAPPGHDAGAMHAAGTGHGHGSERHAKATADGHDHDAHLGSAEAKSERFPGGLVGDLAKGESLYRTNCVACHGEHGDGRGPRAYFILPKPRDFTHPASRSGFNRPHLFQAIARGSVGSEMPAWDTVLDEQSIADVAEYVFQRFILDRAAGAAGAATDVAVAR